MRNGVRHFCTWSRSRTQNRSPLLLAALHESPGRADRRPRQHGDLWPRGRRARADGGGGGADPRHVGRRAAVDRDRHRAGDPVRGGGFYRWPCAGYAVCRARRRAARLPGGGRHRRRHHPPVRALAWPRGQRHGRADRRAGSVAAGSGALPVPQFAAAGACPHAGGRAARSRRARAQYLSHRLPRPAHGHLFGLGGRQIGAFVDAGPQRVGRHFGDRPGRRARPRGAGILAGRSGPGRSRALRGGGLDLGRTGADAPPGGLFDAGDRGIFPRPRQRCAGADGFGHPLCHGAARDRALGWRAADRQGLYADRIHRAAAPARTSRAGHRAGHHHRHFQRAGGRRRP